MLIQQTSHLKRSDPILARIIDEIGPCRLGKAQKRWSYFQVLVEAIIYQQVSMKAGATVYGRFKRLFGQKRFPRPEDVINMPDSQLRGIGLSGQKASYLKDLALKIQSKSVPVGRLCAKADDEIIEALTQVRGIGRWTAEMFLMFRLGRLDVLPVKDLGLQKGIQKAYGFKSLPHPKTVARIAKPWRPYRSIGTWYMWRHITGTNGSAA